MTPIMRSSPSTDCFSSVTIIKAALIILHFFQMQDFFDDLEEMLANVFIHRTILPHSFQIS
jgi:hypothetical protein